MTEREINRLNELLAKKEIEEKLEKEFFSKVRKRKNDVLKYLGVKEDNKENYYEKKLKEIAELYGCLPSELLDHISSDRQIEFYKKYHRKDQA